jgi:hypothetical protein
MAIQIMNSRGWILIIFSLGKMAFKYFKIFVEIKITHPGYT